MGPSVFLDVIMIIIIIKFVNCNWVVTRWQWLFNMYTEYAVYISSYSPTFQYTLSVSSLKVNLPLKWDWQVVPKRRLLTTYRLCVTSKKSEHHLHRDGGLKSRTGLFSQRAGRSLQPAASQKQLIITWNVAHLTSIGVLVGDTPPVIWKARHMPARLRGAPVGTRRFFKFPTGSEINKGTAKFS